MQSHKSGVVGLLIIMKSKINFNSRDVYHLEGYSVLWRIFYTVKGYYQYCVGYSVL